MKKITIILIIIAMALAGCARDKPPVAGLAPGGPEAAKAWGLPDSVKLEGEGNSVRVVKNASLPGDALELATAGNGVAEYYREIGAGPQARMHCRLQLLSTQGTGRVKLAAIDADGRELATVGWVITGQIPAGDSRTKWLDVRYTANYVGDWLTFDNNVAELFAKYWSGEVWNKAAKYRLSVITGQGQHALITACRMEHLAAPAVKLTPVLNRAAVSYGQTFALPVDVENVSSQPVSGLEVELKEPYGYGLIVQQNRVQVLDNLPPGEKRRITWQVKAQRPDAVNLGKPWLVRFAVGGIELEPVVAVNVTDPRPGRVYYVMTEDLEPIDSAGYKVAWGNADGWLQPKELLVQMVQKAEAANRIAEQYGAKWTHYIAWPVIKAAEWAAGQSSTGEWQRTVAAVQASVRSQTAQGHEYGIHLHIDYDPFIQGNVLSYNPAVDGIWANHLRHGWAHSLGNEGHFGDYASRAGTLYSYQRILDELASDSPQGQLLTARVGSFDFGYDAANEAMSTRVYRKVGLWGSSDADGNSGGITSGDYGQEIYFAKPDDINTGAVALNATGLVEFRPTPRDFIQYDSQSAAVMNQKADQGMAHFAPGGIVKPGVHAIIGFTHIMFFMGDGDWQSTQGGQFSALDGHLGYLKGQYVDKGLLTFGTANALVRDYLDYYAPQPVAIYGPRSAAGWGSSEYPIIILGRDIPVDAAHQHTVAVKYPLYLRDSAYRASILKNGVPIYSTWGLPTPDNSLVFTLDDAGAQYSLKIYHNEYINRIISIACAVKAKITNILR